MTPSSQTSVYRYGWEAVDQPLYDCQTYPSSGWVDRLTFFARPVGENGKSFAETNMMLPGTLPTANDYLIRRVSITTPDAEDDSCMRLYWGGSLVLSVADRVYLRLPLIRFALEPYLLTDDLLIHSGVKFALVLDWAAPVELSQGVRICAELGGLLYRRTA